MRKEETFTSGAISEQKMGEAVKLGSRILLRWVAHFSGGLGLGFCVVLAGKSRAVRGFL